MSVPITCCECGVIFRVPDELHTQLRECHNFFYCPAGHRQHYAIKSEKEKLQEQRDGYYRWYQREKDRRYREELSNRALRGVITRMKKPILLIFMERKLIKAALKETNGHRVKAAGLLGISIRTIFRKIKKYNL